MADDVMTLAYLKDNDYYVTGLSDAARIAIDTVDVIKVSLIVQISFPFMAPPALIKDLIEIVTLIMTTEIGKR